MSASPSPLTIRTATGADAVAFCAIYNPYVRNTTISFETQPVDEAEMRRRIQEKQQRHAWLAAEVDGQIAGYAYYGPFRPRPAYDHTVESAIYIAGHQAGKGYGRLLYTALIDSAYLRGYREMIAVIALPNPASLALHLALGFREVGVLQHVGRKFDCDVDVCLWQKSLDAGQGSL
ncbi:MAG: N-acetyltransferase family protein [Anaerolineae bacterium]|nr:N-acetyltransferase family protein [Anaerolineae bacterium]